MLAGTRIALTALYRDDSAKLLDWINDPETVRFNAPYSPVHETAHATWFERVTTDPSRIIFGIRERDTQRLIGVVQLVNLHPIHRSAELIVRIGAEADRGAGLGSEALKLVTRFGFRDKNLQRISLKVFANNARAIRAYEKAGFHKEGQLRRAAFIDGGWQDEIIMALLADDPD